MKHFRLWLREQARAERYDAVASYAVASYAAAALESAAVDHLLREQK